MLDESLGAQAIAHDGDVIELACSWPASKSKTLDAAVHSMLGGWEGNGGTVKPPVGLWRLLEGLSL